MVHSGATRVYGILALALFASCGGRAENVGPGDNASNSGGAGAGSNPGDAGAGTGLVAGAAGQGGSHAGNGGTGGTVSAGSPSMGGAQAGGAPSGIGVLKDYLDDSAYPDDFWTPAMAAEVNMDAALLEQAVDWVATSQSEIHSFLIARNGFLVMDRYGWNSGLTWGDANQTPRQELPSARHVMHSTTKSFLSALIGIAIDEGKIPDGVATKAADWFPDYADLNPSAEKSSISLADLLTMRSGLEYTEGGSEEITNAPDPARAMLSQALVDLPVGTVWNYSSGGSGIIAEILRVATGMTPLEYGQAKLFGPIGIVNPPWAAGASGTNHGGFGLELTAREMARFGELFRNSGAWGGQQVVPAAWTDESTLNRCATIWGHDYAYHWWISNVPGFFNSNGAYGQYIFVNRGLGLVVVFTGNLSNEIAYTVYEDLLRNYVVPAAH
jgi:CubicO group peptidase (beta-lactamase class C family)